eukprot:403373219
MTTQKLKINELLLYTDDQLNNAIQQVQEKERVRTIFAQKELKELIKRISTQNAKLQKNRSEAKDLITVDIQQNDSRNQNFSQTPANTDLKSILSPLKLKYQKNRVNFNATSSMLENNKFMKDRFLNRKLQSQQNDLNSKSNEVMLVDKICSPQQMKPLEKVTIEVHINPQENKASTLTSFISDNGNHSINESNTFLPNIYGKHSPQHSKYIPEQNQNSRNHKNLFNIQSNKSSKSKFASPTRPFILIRTQSVQSTLNSEKKTQEIIATKTKHKAIISEQKFSKDFLIAKNTVCKEDVDGNNTDLQISIQDNLQIPKVQIQKIKIPQTFESSVIISQNQSLLKPFERSMRTDSPNEIKCKNQDRITMIRPSYSISTTSNNNYSILNEDLKNLENYGAKMKKFYFPKMSSSLADVHINIQTPQDEQIDDRKMIPFNLKKQMRLNSSQAITKNLYDSNITISQKLLAPRKQVH